MTPVDLCATAIVSLMINSGTGKAYHVWNNRIITKKDLIKVFRTLGYNVEIYDREKYSKKFYSLIMDKDPELFVGVINDFDAKKMNLILKLTQLMLFYRMISQCHI